MRDSTTVADIGEHAVIQHIRERVPAHGKGVVTGIGDDAAVVEPDRGALPVVTTDTLVEGVHFDRAHSSPADIGDKSLAVNLSDLAAMGAAPRYALLALSLPAEWLVADVDAMLDAFLARAIHHRTTLVGGDVTASPGPLIVGVTVIGSAKRRRVLGRDGARPEDIIYVSGTVGAAAAGLASFQRAEPSADPPPEECRRRHRRPEARVALGIALGRNRAARACMDLSDGLADAVHQIAAASPPAFRGRLRHVRRRIGDLPITPIGIVTKERSVRIRRDGKDEPLPRGYEHFSGAD